MSNWRRKKKEDALRDWLKARKQVIVPIDEKIQTIVAELLGAYPRLVDTNLRCITFLDMLRELGWKF
jgi:hypothetical protein